MSIALAVFIVVYLGMMLGTLPWLKVDRASIALGGATVLLATGAMSTEAAIAAVDFGTMGMLFGLMLLSVQFQMSGLYGSLAATMTRVKASAPLLLAGLVALVGTLSALLTNDVVAVAMTPIVLSVCLRRSLNPVPFLLAVALATNAGSVATIIGSPQNMLIAERLDLSFGGYMVYTAVPALLALLICWALLVWRYRDRWQLAHPLPAEHPEPPTPAEHWETVKGLLVLALVLYAFVFTDWSRGLVAAAAGVFMLFNARFVSRNMLERVDWDLLILFGGLFLVNAALQNTGLPRQLVNDLSAWGFDLGSAGALFVVTAILSDIASNVPTVMLLLPFASEPHAGPLMALASGLASNLIIIGSLANIIVVDAAATRGLKISFMEFARAGVPVSIASLAVAAAWVWLIAPAG